MTRTDSNERLTICSKCKVPFEWQTDIMLEALCPQCMANRRIELAIVMHKAGKFKPKPK